MKRWAWMVGATALLTSTAGCGGLCNTCPNGMTIVPPATYSMQIPNTAQNPYYNGNTTVNPTGTAPTPAASSPGWQTIGNGPLSQLYPNVGGVGTSTVQSSTAVPGGHTSFRDSVNYQSTSIDETQDASRLAVTDASGVRAPTVSTSPAPASYGQLVPGTFVTSPRARVINGHIENGGMLVANPSVYSAPQYSYGYPVQQQEVLAQATTVYDPYQSPSHQNVWRNRSEDGIVR